MGAIERYFLNVESALKYGRVIHPTGVGEAGLVEKFKNTIAEAHVFNFSEEACKEMYRPYSDVDPKNWPDSNTREKQATLDHTKVRSECNLAEEVSLPFRTCLFTFGTRHAHHFGNAQDRAILMCGMLIKEISPDELEMFISASYIPIANGTAEEAILYKKTRLGDIGNFFSDIFPMYYLLGSTRLLSTHKVGIEKGPALVMKDSKRGAQVKLHNSNTILHVSTEREYVSQRVGHKSLIHWEKNSYCRGHWRSFYRDGETDSLGRKVVDYSRLGKNRSGEYEVAGYTWVTDHVRGNPELARLKQYNVRT